jgi:hypothetical protein
MNAVTAAVPSRVAHNAAELEREILTRIARGGLLICETELRYQLRRHAHEHDHHLLNLLATLEQRGLIESETHYRLTPVGVARVPPGDLPARHQRHFPGAEHHRAQGEKPPLALPRHCVRRGGRAERSGNRKQGISSSNHDHGVICNSGTVRPHG